MLLLRNTNTRVTPKFKCRIRKAFFLLLTFAFVLFSFTSFSQTYQWAHGFGGPNNNAQGNSIATDAQGNVYVTGDFGDTIDFDPGAGTATLYPTAGGEPTVFIAKYDSSGVYQWAKSLNQSFGDCRAEKIVVNNTGIYLAGHFFLSIDFDPGPGNATLNSIGGWSGDEDIFIAHYDLNGNYLWAKSMGGLNEEKALDMAVDNVGNSYITGYFRDVVDFDPDTGTATLVSNGFQDAFFAKYDSNGDYVWAYDLCDSNSAAYNSIIELDNTNNDIYLSGAFTGTVDFDRGVGIFNMTDNNYTLRYIAKYDTSGSFLWAGNISAASGITITSISIDNLSNSNLLICGYFSGLADFDLSSGVFNVIPNNNYSVIYFAKYTSSGNLILIKQTNSTGILGTGKRIITDSKSSICLTGEFTGTTDFDPNVGISNLIANGNSRDIFFAKYDSTGNYVWVRSIGGVNTDEASSIALDYTGNIYLTGYFTNSMDADPDNSVVLLNPSTSQNIFIGKYSNTLTGIFEWEKASTSSLVVFPNPSTQIITISNMVSKSSLLSKISITNAAGDVIYQEFASVSQKQPSINIKFLPPGIYCISAISDNGLVSAKFIKN